MHNEDYSILLFVCEYYLFVTKQFQSILLVDTMLDIELKTEFIWTFPHEHHS